MYDPPPTLLLYAIHHTILVMAVSCKKINRSHIHTHTHTHTHTDREQHPRHRHRHAHDKNNTPNPQTNTSHKHLTTLEVGATTVRATSHARAVSCQRRGELAFIRYCFTWKLFSWSLSSFYCPPPPAPSFLLQYYYTTIAQYTPRHRPSPFMPCTIQYKWWQYRVKAKRWDAHWVVYFALPMVPLRSWLQYTLKRKLVDFAWNRRWF